MLSRRVPLYRVDQIHEECRLRGVKMVLIMLTNDPDEMIDLAKRLQPFCTWQGMATRLMRNSPST